LQRAIKKYGLNNFDFVIYEFYCPKNKNITLVQLEDTYIKKFDFNSLYNLKKSATSMLGYKHTEEASLKMKLRLLDKSNHPMYGKKHSDFTKDLISLKTKGSLNEKSSK
jgi:group I intron endonuclease